MTLPLWSAEVPKTGEVHVRRVRLAQEPACLEMLSEDERARAGRFHFERDRQCWAAGRTALRRMLGAYLGQSPGQIVLATGPWGKLFVCGCPLRFNVSHSDDTALLAFSWGQEVGIDVERRRIDFSPDALAAQVFSVEEQAALRETLPEQRHAKFLTLWTAKEAFVKARGEGLSYPLDRLTLRLITGTDRFQVLDAASGGTRPEMSVIRLFVDAGHCAALALEGRLHRVCFSES